MKKTLIYIIITAIASTIAADGKTVRRKLNIFKSSVPETETIVNETMEFIYDYSYSIDTLDRIEDRWEEDQMLLQIAPNGVSKFSSFKNITVDSLLMSLSSEQIVDAAMDGKLSNGDFMTIFKNYPQGKLTHAEKVCEDWFKYEEELPELDWELSDSTITVLGYECRKATCSFRGREWTAWYSEDIPVMNGPWKLGGLPGLIMKAYDRNKEYAFECVGINSHADRPITIYKVPFNNTSRAKFYDARHRYEVNPYAYAEAVSGIHVTVRDEAGNEVMDAYDPIELSFDFIETDWR